MTKLWDKGYQINHNLEAFMAGSDPLLDLKIAKYDCLASIAHAKMLAAINILTATECEALTSALKEIIKLLATDSFNIDMDQEDIHTAIENHLIAKLGDIGKKIHTGRSRNDQVLTALRLYSKAKLEDIYQSMIAALEVFYAFTVKYQNIPYVGRTHFQKAMPSSFGLWGSAMIESLLDDIKLISNAYQIIDQSPLGSAASYGVNLALDREYSSQEMGFNKVQNNVLYANNSRGKFEGIIIHGLSQIMLDLAKLSTDIIIFAAPEFGYLNLPEEFCPGSSLMPNKKNPDPFELIRAKSASVISKLMQVMEISRGLPSGYNRDFQETKEPLISSFEITQQSLEVVALIMAKVTVNEEKCLVGFSPEVFATDHALALATSGIPFRDAYRETALNIDKLELNDPVSNILAKKHQGATGNLGLDLLYQQIQDLKQTIRP